MQLRRHKDIIAIKNGNHPPVAFHARNLEVATVSEEVWQAMAPSAFSNGFDMSLEKYEVPLEALEGYESLLSWQDEFNPETLEPQKDHLVSNITLNVTQLCNLHCTYCAAGGDGTYGDPVARISVDKTFPQIKYFIEKLPVGHYFQITFLGGEPLLYPEAIKKIAQFTQEIAAAKGVQTRFNIITNATLINDETLNTLTGLRANFTVSIDGPPEAHDKARPQKNGQGSAAAAINGLRHLLARKSEFGKISLHAVFSKNNLEVEAAYNFFQKFAVDSYEFTFDVTESDESANHKFMAEMSKVAAQAYAESGEEALRRITLFDRYFKALDGQQKTENYCGSGKSLLSLDSRNKIYACPLDVGHAALQVGENESIDSEKLQDLQPAFIEKNNCQTCWARYLCGGGCLFSHKALTGNKHKKHISFCERTRYLISLTLMYYELSRG